MRDRYTPVAITAAVTGGDVLPSQSPAIPCGAEAIAREALRAAEAGAACVHIHAREDDGRPTGSPELFREILERIRDESDVVVNFSTGGAPGMPESERLSAIKLAKPEIASFNLGTMNYEGFPTPERWPSVNTEWERTTLTSTGTKVFTNTLSTMRRFAGEMRELGIVPELEAYDVGHLSMARFLIDEGTLEPPVRIQFVLGVLGAGGTDLEDLFIMKQAAERILGEDIGTMCVAATGYPAEFRHAATALAWGLDCRVGLEDNLRVRRDRQAASNAELVEVAVKLADLVGRPVMTAAEFRESVAAFPWRGATVATT